MNEVYKQKVDDDPSIDRKMTEGEYRRDLLGLPEGVDGIIVSGDKLIEEVLGGDSHHHYQVNMNCWMSVRGPL